jgi:ubiquinone/menaquinone biosynthesis C-methylase UbiE
MGLAAFLHGDPQSGTRGMTIGPARRYEVVSRVLFLGRRRRAFARIIALGEVGPGDRVLDVGCGPGCLTRLAGRAVLPGGSVLGIDPSPTVIEYARRSKHGSECSFELGTAEALDVPDGSVDVVLSSLVMHHLPEDVRLQALREMLRVLRPGGRLLVADFRPPKSRIGRHLIGAVLGPEMAGNLIDQLEPLVRGAGFMVPGQGDLHPFLHYVRGVCPVGAAS